MTWSASRLQHGFSAMRCVFRVVLSVGLAASVVRAQSADLQRANEEFNAGTEAYQAGRVDAALTHWEAALAMLLKIPGTEREQADCHVNIGTALRNMARYEDGIARTEKALAMYQQIKGTERDQADCHMNIGNALDDMARYEEAIARYDKALAIYQQIKGTERDQANCHVNIGVTLDDMARYEEAIARQEKALAMYLQIKGTERQQAACHQNIGVSLDNMARYEEAIARQEKALAMYLQIKGTERQQAGCHVNIGAALLYMSRDEEAIARQEKALAIFQQIKGTERQQADCHNYIGAALQSMAHHEDGIARHEKALAMYQQIKGTEREQANCHVNIGNALWKMARYEEAIALYEKALAMFEKILGTEREQAASYANIGEALTGMSRYDEAIARYEKALAMFQQIKGAERNSESARTSIAEVRLKQGRFSLAVDGYRQAREQGWGVWIGTGLARALEMLGSTEDLRGAAEELVVTLSRSATERGKSYGMEARMSASSEAAPAYGHLSRFLVNRSRESWELKESELINWATATKPEARCLEAAFHYADAGKARTLTELVQQRQVDFGQDPKGKALLDEDRQLLLQIGKAHERKLSLPSDAEVSRKEVDDQIAGLQQRRRQIEFELKKTYVGKFTVPEYQKASEIQASLPDGMAVLQYVVTEDDSRLIVLTKGSIAAYDIPVKAEAPWEILNASKGRWDESAMASLAGRFATEGSKIGLEGMVRLYRAPLEAADPRGLSETMVRVGMELSNVLLPEAARKLLKEQKTEHLVILPDGPLHLVPFAALPVGTIGSGEAKSLGECRFLVEDYRISYLPSWAMLGSIRSAASERKSDSKQKELLALADPVFSKDDPRITGSSNKLAQAGPVELTAVLRNYYEKYGWKRLPDTGDEARGVASVFGKASLVDKANAEPSTESESVIYSGPAATVKALERAGQYKRLLLATHGVADPRNAWLSCVVLSAPPEQGYESPGYLKAADIVGLKLNADLVTLSACETGLGRLENGEGMIGLSSAFFMAGARSLALTLWKVPSGETVEVSIRFHELLKTQANKAEALRQAQLDFLAKHPDKRHPFYWAAFILTGDWK